MHPHQSSILTFDLKIHGAGWFPINVSFLPLKNRNTRDDITPCGIRGEEKSEAETQGATALYIQLDKALFQEADDEFHFATARTVEEAGKLIKVGFEYVCHYESVMLLRKRK
ncbi:MAG: hypothetical protein QMD23_06185 [Candidatus Bathyarchaeia archaeon]|nr:hypothetical protein [Candidatus Bathyarchaeia archaeon]